MHLKARIDEPLFSLCKDNVCSDEKSFISMFDVNGTFHPKIKNAYIHLICNAIMILLYIVLFGDTELKKYSVQGYILYSFIHSVTDRESTELVLSVEYLFMCLNLVLQHIDPYCKMTSEELFHLPLNVYIIILGIGLFILMLSLVFCCYLFRYMRITAAAKLK